MSFYIWMNSSLIKERRLYYFHNYDFYYLLYLQSFTTTLPTFLLPSNLKHLFLNHLFNSYLVLKLLHNLYQTVSSVFGSKSSLVYVSFFIFFKIYLLFIWSLKEGLKYLKEIYGKGVKKVTILKLFNYNVQWNPTVRNKKTY